MIRAALCNSYDLTGQEYDLDFLPFNRFLQINVISYILKY